MSEFSSLKDHHSLFSVEPSIESEFFSSLIFRNDAQSLIAYT